jgi:rubrerythrin
MLKPLFEEYNTEIPQDNSSDYIVYPETITEGLETGVIAEINNIAMYEKFLTQDIPDDIREVFEELMNASMGI